MFIFQEQDLSFTDFFQTKLSGHNRFYCALLNAINQVTEHLWLYNCASKQAEIFQIQSPDIQLNKGTGDGTRYCTTTTGT